MKNVKLKKYIYIYLRLLIKKQPLFAQLGSKQHNLHNLYQVPSNLPERTLFAVWEKTATTRVLFLEGELGLGSAPIQLRNFNTIY